MPMIVEEIDVQRYDDIVATQPCIVFFMTPWCNSCKEMLPAIGEVAAAYGDRLAVYKIDFEDYPHVAANNGVMVVPTLIFYKDGVGCDRITGAKDMKAVTTMIETNLSG